MKKLVLLLVVLVGLGSSTMAQGIAHVDSQVLWDTLPSAKTALAKYAKYEKDAYDELTAMQTEFETAYRNYEMKKADMPRAEREYQEKKLMDSQQRIETTNQSLKDFLISTSNDLNAPLQDRIQRAVNIVAERMKLAYVIDASTAIYSAGGKNITKEVVIELLKLDATEAPTTPK